MKIVYPMIFILSIIPFGLLAQLSLSIEINNLRNNKGQVHLELSNENEEQVVGVTKNISNNKCVFVIENLEPGKYAFKFFHDENKNDKLDTNWLGIPKEGFGFSNNPSMTFGPPSFDKTIFELKESISIKCKPKYF
jgi:uncharacterized protein (DUF2141 family)